METAGFRAVGATIVETDTDGGATWRVNIHDNALGDAVAAFLERHGAPAFPTVVERNAYAVELERHLRAGSPIVAARDAALRAIGRTLDAAEHHAQVRRTPAFDAGP